MSSVIVLPAASNGQSADFKSLGKTNTGVVDQGSHAYKCQGQDDIRSPCPALNTLANHSYLPHDGRNITFFALIRALHAGYGISIGFATFLTIGSYMLLRRSPRNPLDLREVSRHDRIAHNCSVAHDDVDGHEYAPSPVNADLLRKFLKKAYTPPAVRESESEETITFEDLVYTRIAREAASGPIDALHAEIARGEFAMVMDIFGKGTHKTLNKKDLEVWLKENRLPDGWSPNHLETLSETVAESKEMRELMEHIQDKVAREEHHELGCNVRKAVQDLLQGVETMNLHGNYIPSVN